MAGIAFRISERKLVKCALTIDGTSVFFTFVGNNIKNPRGMFDDEVDGFKILLKVST